MAPSAARLIVRDASGSQREVEVSHTPFTLGRQSDNDLVLLDSRVSRHHARILHDGQGYVLEDVAQVLVMSVNPGFGGQSFIPEMLPKVRLLHDEIRARQLAVDIEIDGGVKVDNVAQAAAAGANVIVAGSAVFESTDYGATIAALRARAEQAAR